MPSSQPNFSLISGMNCLQAVFSANKPVGSRELSRLLEIDHAKVNRHLKTLATEGFVVQDLRRKYLPGPAIHILAAQSLRASGLLIKALPHLKTMIKKGYSVALGTLWQEKVCYLFHGKKGQPFESGIAGSSLYPAKESSIGMVLMSEQFEEYEGKLKKELKSIRKKGSAIIGPNEDTYSIATPIGNPAIAAIAFSGNIKSSEIPDLLKTLKNIAKLIDNELS